MASLIFRFSLLTFCFHAKVQYFLAFCVIFVLTSFFFLNLLFLLMFCFGFFNLSLLSYGFHVNCFCFWRDFHANVIVPSQLIVFAYDFIMSSLTFRLSLLIHWFRYHVQILGLFACLRDFRANVILLSQPIAFAHISLCLLSIFSFSRLTHCFCIDFFLFMCCYVFFNFHSLF